MKKNLALSCKTKVKAIIVLPLSKKKNNETKKEVKPITNETQRIYFFSLTPIIGFDILQLIKEPILVAIYVA